MRRGFTVAASGAGAAAGEWSGLIVQHSACGRRLLGAINAYPAARLIRP